MVTKLKFLKNHDGFTKYFKNTSWLFIEKILRMLVGLFVGVWVARYLGPNRFGLLSYAQSFVGLFSAIATLGLDGIVVRELVKYPDKENLLLGTAFYLKLMGAILTLMILYIVVHLISNDHYSNTIIFIIASAMIFQSFNVIDMYFQSKVMSKFVVYTNMISLFISSMLKITLILINAPLITFAWLVLFDNFVLAFGYIYFFLKNSKFKIQNLRFNKLIAVRLLKDSWLMAIAGAAILIYMKIDQVMIKEMIDSKAVGEYAAAVRISEAWYFIPMVIASSLFPAIVNAKKQSEDLYYKRLQKLYDLMVWMAIFLVFPISFFSDSIVNLLYGSQYNQAGSVFKIHILASLFVFLSVVNDKWFYIENKSLLLTKKVIIGAISNIVLNVILIPFYGIIGAAVATIISYGISVLLSDLIFKDMKEIFWMKMKALSFYSSFQYLLGKKNEL